MLQAKEVGKSSLDYRPKSVLCACSANEKKKYVSVGNARSFRLDDHE
jgi:hypothetical protein